MKLAIVGSRGFDDFALMESTINDLELEIIEIVSGGARGADTLAQQYADKYHIDMIVFLADWKRHGRAAGFKRNVEIVNYCDQMIVFWDGQSAGTAHNIQLAKQQHKLLFVVTYGPTLFD